MKINWYDSLAMKAVKHTWNAIPTLFKGLTILLGMQTAVMGLPILRRGAPYSLRDRPTPGTDLVVADVPGSTVKILNSKLCIQATLRGPVPCDRVVTRNDLVTTNDDGTVSHVDALSVRETFPRNRQLNWSGLLWVCQTTVTSGQRNPATTDCRSMPLDQFEVPEQRSGFAAPIPSSSDVTIGDLDLIQRARPSHR